MDQEIIECVFETNDGVCSCVRGGCGRTLRLRRSGNDCSTVKAVCRGTGPGTLEKVANLAKAAAAHLAAGRPRASEEEIMRRFSICVECELYKKVDDASGYCTHAKCGCNVKANVDDFLNKAAWAEQKCPHPKGDKWNAT